MCYAPSRLKSKKILLEVKRMIILKEIFKSTFIAYGLILLCCNCRPDFDDLQKHTNYFEGLEVGQQEDKPIFLFFSAYTLGDRRFENEFGRDKVISKLISEEFVFIYLAIDDPREFEVEYKEDVLNYFNLTESTQRTNSIGDLNYIILINKYKTNFQPLYAIVDSQGNELIEKFGYTTNKNIFREKLTQGLEAFGKR